jgi:hypothetical protein
MSYEPRLAMLRQQNRLKNRFILISSVQTVTFCKRLILLARHGR